MHVADVLVDGISVGGGTDYTFTGVDRNHMIQAYFAVNTYTLSTAVVGGHGAISPSGSQTVNYGASRTYTITPDSGYRVQDVKVRGVSVGARTSYTFTNVTSSGQISASFAANAYPITASAGTGGRITPSGTVNVRSGMSQSFTFTPSSGYEVAQVTVDGSNVVNRSSYNFTNVRTSHSISVSFRKRLVLTVTRPASGVRWKKGSTQTVTWYANQAVSSGSFQVGLRDASTKSWTLMGWRAANGSSSYSLSAAPSLTVGRQYWVQVWYDKVSATSNGAVTVIP
jgi:hypothetical protein